jgi:hypothetical protein
MLRNLLVCCIGLLYLTQAPALPAQAAPAQARDPRVDQLTKDTDELKHTVADQEKRIADLEKTVKMLQAQAAPPPPAPIPNPTAPWTSAANWSRVKAGMSEADVVEILGPASSVTSVEDSRTLYYQPGPSSTSTLSGTVTLKDDRVTAMSPPAF